MMELVEADPAMVADLCRKLLRRENAHLLTEDERVCLRCLLEDCEGQ